MVRLWFLCLTAFYFTGFAIGALALSLLWLPTVSLFFRGYQRTLIARKSIYYGFRFFWWFARIIHFMDTNFEGCSALSSQRGMLVIANHPSYLDYVLIASTAPTLDCLIKEQILHKPTLKFLATAADYLVNSEGGQVLAQSVTRLRQGENLLIFPEGTRTPRDGTLKFKHGFASIALRAQCPICLITISCSQPFLDKAGKWYNVPAEKITFKVKVEEILTSEQILKLTAPANSPYQKARRLTGYLEQLFSERKGQVQQGNNQQSMEKDGQGKVIH